MNIFAVTILFAWPIFVLLLHLVLKPERAAILSFLLGWLYLPVIILDVPGLPPYGKFTATSIGVLPCIVLFGLDRLIKFRPSIMDLSILIWIAVPLGSSLTNQLGLMDGVSGVIRHLLEYGVPYFVGRICLKTPAEWVFLTKAIVYGALSYIPFCLLEMRISPQLHMMAFGSSGVRNFEVASGFGPLKWAPSVFMNGPFEVTMLMAMATLATFCAAKSKSIPKILGFNTYWFFFGFFVFVLLCKKWSGLGLLTLGIASLLFVENLRTRLSLFALVALPILYMTCFSSGVWRAEGISEQIAAVSARRAESFQFRIDNDVRLIDKAMQRPWFGWGGWGRNRIYDEEGKDISITDSAFGIYLGVYGLLGLIAVTALYSIPYLVFILRYSPRSILSHPVVLATPFAIALALHLNDNLFNSFPNVMYAMFAGGITTVTMSKLFLTDSLSRPSSRVFVSDVQNCRSTMHPSQLP